MATVASDDELNIDNMKVKELREYLRERRLPVSGTKGELLARVKGAKDMQIETVSDDVGLSSKKDNEKLVSPLGEVLPNPDNLTDWSDAKEVPNFTEKELYDFLVLSKHRSFDNQGLGARRALKAKVFYEDRHVHSVKFHPVFDKCSHAFIKCKCIPSLPTSNIKKRPDYDVWICLSKVTSRVHSANCTCTAGSGESCNHIAALLFAMIDMTVRRNGGEFSSTSMKCKWIQPRKRKLSPVKAAEVNFQKFEWKKTKRTKKVEDIHDEEVPVLNVDSFKDKLSNVYKHAAWLQNFESDKPEENKENYVPPELHDVNFMYSDKVDLTSSVCLSFFEDYFSTLKVTSSDAKTIEKNTREQALSSVWRQVRKGRLTSSTFGTIVRRKDDTPPDNLLKVLLGYVPQFETAATRWGRKFEGVARDSYVSFQQTIHLPMTVQQSGFIVNPHMPHLGASPDGLVYCPHCKEYNGLLEIKCPYRLRNSTPTEAAKDKNFFCTISSSGTIRLKRNHAYFYQIQGQMAISNRKWCDFVIWTNCGMNIERISFDENLWLTEMLPKLNMFYKRSMLPELFSKRVMRKLKL